jgi:DNA-binding NarL/FixJ family response regulator
MSPIRILVVDDYAQWRDFVGSMLQKVPTVRVICEVSDGAEAVQKAKELKPDLILLDVGLPKLNGIEAARQIRKVAAESKIVFLSQETSADVVQEAIGLGASGYVFKATANGDLLRAISNALRGKQFVSTNVPANIYREALAAD